MLLVVAFTATFFFIGDSKLNELAKLKNESNERVRVALESSSILAKAVSVYDLTDNAKIYGRNDDIALPIASLAKIISVVVGLEGHDLNEIVYVSGEAVKQAGDFGIFANEKWKIGDIAKFTLIVSANDGAYALSERKSNFLTLISNKSKKLGAPSTLFLNATGLDLDANTKSGAWANAMDVNLMASYALRAYPEIFSVTTLPEINLISESGFEHNFKNTNILIGKIPNLLFSKTGYTEVAGGNLTIIFKNQNDHEIAITLLGSTFDGRFADMEKIVEILYNF